MNEEEERDPRAEAREFLVDFLTQLQANDRTTRQLVHVQTQALAQAQADYQQRAMISGQLDGIAQRLDLATHQMAVLSSVLEGENEDPSLRRPPHPPHPPYPSVGQSLGQTLGVGFDRFLGGGGGRRRR